jgi:hypothetical protein
MFRVRISGKAPILGKWCNWQTRQAQTLSPASSNLALPTKYASVVELADTLDLGSSAPA